MNTRRKFKYCKVCGCKIINRLFSAVYCKEHANIRNYQIKRRYAIGLKTLCKVNKKEIKSIKCLEDEVLEIYGLTREKIKQECETSIPSSNTIDCLKCLEYVKERVNI